MVIVCFILDCGLLGVIIIMLLNCVVVLISEVMFLVSRLLLFVIKMSGCDI